MVHTLPLLMGGVGAEADAVVAGRAGASGRAEARRGAAWRAPSTRRRCQALGA